MTEPDRPDPDALLERVRAEEAQRGRARLKIFLGFAPGVGKTYEMLESARRLAQGGVDVVVGCVETHGRRETAALLGGLEILPRRRVEYRGAQLDELDLDRAIARRPRLLLVDELAHTNAPGGRHDKRWQDVLELLDAGVDVHTTLNIQHVESLVDVVQQISGVRVRETVPDALLERADEIALVDIPPDELLARLRDGKVYLGEQAARAAAGFFSRGNLLALRELALRRTADRVDADVLAYRRAHEIAATWPTGERILVCVSPSPASARLVRAARRMAAGLRAPWVAAYVEVTARPPLGDDDRARVDAHLRLAESLGGQIAELEGLRPADAIIAYARAENVTRIVIGKPTHPRLLDRVRGSLLDELVRKSGDIDVHVISGDAGDERPAPREPAPSASIEPYLWSVGNVVLATMAAEVARHLLALPDLVMIYLLVIMMVAARLGRGPALLASTLSVAAYDFCFVPPYYTFAVSDTRHLLTFLMMFTVGVLISTLVLRLRRQEQAARLREARTASLYALAGALGAEVEASGIARVAAAQAATIVRAPAAIVAAPGVGGALAVMATEGELAVGPDEEALARWVLEHGRAAGRGTDTLPGARTTAFPLSAHGTLHAVLLLGAPPGGRGLDAGARHFVEAVAGQVGLALARARLADEARAAALYARTEELRSSLLSAVSHDLRTPLATLFGTATLLRDRPELERARRDELLELMCAEAERLERLVANLLDMTRVASHTLQVAREWFPLEEVVGSALTRLEKVLDGHPVEVALPADLPLLSADPLLVEQVLFNLLDNAAKHTAPGTRIAVRARVEADAVVVEVADAGEGLDAGSEERVFQKFQRGARPRAAGAGLGLAIARGMAEAHGGSLTAHRGPEGGALFRLRLPRVEGGPSIEAEA